MYIKEHAIINHCLADVVTSVRESPIKALCSDLLIAVLRVVSCKV